MLELWLFLNPSLFLLGINSYIAALFFHVIYRSLVYKSVSSYFIFKYLCFPICWWYLVDFFRFDLNQVCYLFFHLCKYRVFLYCIIAQHLIICLMDWKSLLVKFLVRDNWIWCSLIPYKWLMLEFPYGYLLLQLKQKVQSKTSAYLPST